MSRFGAIILWAFAVTVVSAQEKPTYDRETIFAWYAENNLPEDVKWWSETDALAASMDEAERVAFWNAILALPPNSKGRARGIERWMKGWPRANGREAFEHVWLNPSKATEKIPLTERVRMLEEWAEDQGAPAVNAALGLPDGEERDLAIREALLGMAKESPGDAYALAKASLSLEAGHQLLSTLMRAWARADREAAFAEAMQLEGPWGMEMRGAAVSGWAREQPITALRWCARLEEGDERARLVSSICAQVKSGKLIEHRDVLLGLFDVGTASYISIAGELLPKMLDEDPVAAVEWLDETHDPGQRVGIVANCISRLEEDHFPTLAAWFAKHPHTTAKARVRESLYHYWAREAWQDAFDSLTALTEAKDPDRESLLAAVSAHAPSASRLQQGLSNLPRNQTGSAERSLIQKMFREDAAKALAWITEQPTQRQEFLYASIIFQWSRKDPQAAADFALGQSEDFQRKEMDRLVRHWASKNPEAAFAWALIHAKQPIVHDTVINRIFEAISKKDPTKAASLLALLPPEVKRPPRPVSIVAGAWAKNDPESAARWLATLKAQDASRSWEPVLRAWANSDLKALQAWADDEAQESTRDLAYEKIIPVVAHNDVRKGFAMLSQLPNEKARNNVILRLSVQWEPQIQKDRSPKELAEHAKALITTLPAGTDRDELVRITVERLFGRAPAEAFALATLIRAKPSRHAMMRRAARQWLSVDEAAAETAIRSSELSEDAIKNLLAE